MTIRENNETTFLYGELIEAIIKHDEFWRPILQRITEQDIKDAYKRFAESLGRMEGAEEERT